MSVSLQRVTTVTEGGVPTVPDSSGGLSDLANVMVIGLVFFFVCKICVAKLFPAIIRIDITWIAELNALFV